MRIVGVSRVLNEGELIEAFVRYHATMLDLHIILDNGSTDQTLPILQALHAEGMPLQVLRTTSPIMLEDIYNTGLFNLARAAGADWICYLDADELLDLSNAASDLSTYLETVQQKVQCLKILVFRYRGLSSLEDPNPFKRMTRRERQPHMSKIFIRGTDQHQVSIYEGNHGAFIDGVATEGVAQAELRLLHFPERTPLQTAKKIILARIKALASGAAVAAISSIQQAAPLQSLTQDAGRWLAEFNARNTAALTSADLVDDPVDWCGVTLKYTTESDELANMIQQFASHATALAMSHGALLDKASLLRTELREQGALAQQVL